MHSGFRTRDKLVNHRADLNSSTIHAMLRRLFGDATNCVDGAAYFARTYFRLSRYVSEPTTLASSKKN